MPKALYKSKKRKNIAGFIENIRKKTKFILYIFFKTFCDIELNY